MEATNVSIFCILTLQMKRCLQLILMILLVTFQSNRANSQIFEHKDFVFEVDMGFPNLKPFFSNFSSFNHGLSFNETNGKQGGFGQLIVKSEFFLADRVGLISYVSYRYFYDLRTIEYSSYDGDTDTWNYWTYDYRQNSHYFRWGVGVNFHLLRTDRLDSYLGILGGRTESVRTLKTDDPTAELGNEFSLPFQARIHYGLRYLFNQNFGFNFEFGLGGPLLSAGLTYKF